jgi:hypothetical protein
VESCKLRYFNSFEFFDHTPYRPRDRNDCKHNHCVKARLAHFSPQSQRRGTTPGVVRPAQFEGTADPLASVLAKSRLMSVGQEFRSEKNETSSRISVQQPSDDCGPLPVWSPLSGRGSEASLRARLLSRGYTRGICPRAEAFREGRMSNRSKDETRRPRALKQARRITSKGLKR